MEFADDNLKNWQAVDPVALFDAPDEEGVGLRTGGLSFRHDQEQTQALAPDLVVHYPEGGRLLSGP